LKIDRSDKVHWTQIRLARLQKKESDKELQIGFYCGAPIQDGTSVDVDCMYYITMQILTKYKLSRLKRTLHQESQLQRMSTNCK
jgi:hypothetical protein